MRSSVLEIVMQAPPSGLTSRQIREKLALRTSLQRLRGHLKRLEDLGLIHSQLDPTHRLRLIYFPGKQSGNREEGIGNREEDKSATHYPLPIPYQSIPHSPFPIPYSQVIVCKSDPKHKRRFLYFSVNQNAVNS